MRFAVVHRIVIDPARCAEGRSAIRTPDKHHIAAGRSARRDDAGQQIYIVVGRTTRAVCRDKKLTYQTFGIDRLAAGKISAHVDRRALIKGRNYGAYSCVTRTERPDLTGSEIDSSNEQIAAAIDIQGSPGR